MVGTVSNRQLGAVVGHIDSNGTVTITGCYYCDCQIGHFNTTGNLGYTYYNNRVDNVYTLTLPSGVTATGETVVIDGTTYYAEGCTVTLAYSSNVPVDQMLVYSVNGTAIEGDTFTMPEQNTTVAVSLVSIWSGSGTSGSPYIITTTAQLDALAAAVNGGTSYSGKFFKLGADIAYDGTENNYTPIGNSSKDFQGTFDGDGYAVSGIHINTSGDYQGLFGYVNSGGTVKNVTLRSSTITGKDYVGGIVSYLYRGTVTDCRVEGTVTIGAYNNNSCRHGGIVGIMDGYATVNGCISAATVTNNGKSGCSRYGGIVGYAAINSAVSNNIALGANVSATTCIGAIVGYRSNGTTLANNYYHGCTVNGATTNIGVGTESIGISGDVTEDDGAVPVTAASHVDITAHTQNAGWYLIASPLANTVDSIRVINLTANQYDLYRFNQSADLEWENWKAAGTDHHHFNIEPSKGYLYANSANETLYFAGTPYSGNGEVTLTKTTGADLEGWNLIGNPFADTAYIKDAQNNAKPYYKMNDLRKEIIAATIGSSIAPMEGIFVVATTNGETVTFTQQRSRADNDDEEGSIVLDLSHGGAVIDRAIVRFGGPSTLRQAQGSGTAQALPKFQIREGSTKVYIPQDGKDYAVVNVGRDAKFCVSTMPINFKAAENGEYTISVNIDHLEMGYLHLIDNMTGADVDLLATNGGDAISRVSTYTFTARTTDYESRFKLVFATNNDGPSTGSGAFAFIDASGNIILTADACDASLQVIDMMGRVIVCTDVARNVSTQGMTPGVYVLRLINGNDVKTQKIMMR